MIAVRVEQVTIRPPAELAFLDQEARLEGCGIVSRLLREWNDNTNRFDGDGERLMIAWVDGAVAGVGGVTRDPVVADALRMRRFYVRATNRRLGVARRLAEALVRHARELNRPIVVNAGTADAPAFWESLGFVLAPCDSHTHVLPTREKSLEQQE